MNHILDLALVAWILLIAVQHLTLVAAAYWWVPGKASLPDLHSGYWLLGPLLLLGAGICRSRLAPEVAHDR